MIYGLGFAWGLGANAFGLALVNLGIGLGLALMLGLTAGLGCLVPMVVLRPYSLTTRARCVALAGNAALSAGISLCAFAGNPREKKQNATATHRSSRSALLVGLLLAVAAAVFGSAVGNYVVANKSWRATPPIIWSTENAESM